MKKPTQKDRVKAWLLEHGNITTGDALHRMKPEIRQLHQRIAELREEGMKIEADWLRLDGVKTKEYRYTLAERPVKKETRMRVEMRNGIPIAVPYVVETAL